MFSLTTMQIQNSIRGYDDVKKNRKKKSNAYTYIYIDRKTIGIQTYL